MCYHVHGQHCVLCGSMNVAFMLHSGRASPVKSWRFHHIPPGRPYALSIFACLWHSTRSAHWKNTSILQSCCGSSFFVKKSTQDVALGDPDSAWCSVSLEKWQSLKTSHLLQLPIIIATLFTPAFSGGFPSSANQEELVFMIFVYFSLGCTYPLLFSKEQPGKESSMKAQRTKTIIGVLLNGFALTL